MNLSQFKIMLNSSNESLNTKRRKVEKTCQFSMSPTLRIELDSKINEITGLSRSLKEKNDLLEATHPVDVYDLDFADRMFRAESQRNHLIQMKENLKGEIHRTVTRICKEKIAMAIEHSENVYEFDIEDRINQILRILVLDFPKEAKQRDTSFVGSPRNKKETEDETTTVKCSSKGCFASVHRSLDHQQTEMTRCSFCRCAMCTSCVLDAVARGRLQKKKLVFQARDDEFERYELYMRNSLCPECSIAYFSGLPIEKLELPKIRKV